MRNSIDNSSSRGHMSWRWKIPRKPVHIRAATALASVAFRFVLEECDTRFLLTTFSRQLAVDRPSFASSGSVNALTNGRKKFGRVTSRRHGKQRNDECGRSINVTEFFCLFVCLSVVKGFANRSPIIADGGVGEELDLFVPVGDHLLPVGRPRRSRRRLQRQILADLEPICVWKWKGHQIPWPSNLWGRSICVVFALFLFVLPTRRHWPQSCSKLHWSAQVWATLASSWSHTWTESIGQSRRNWASSRRLVAAAILIESPKKR